MKKKNLILTLGFTIALGAAILCTYLYSCSLSFRITDFKRNQSYKLELAIYTAIFGFYLVSRVALYLKNTKKNGAGNYLRTIGIPTVFVLSICLIWVQIPQENDEMTIETQSIALADTEEPSSSTYQDGESVEVDTISGATFSSKGIIKAVSDALQKAQS